MLLTVWVKATASLNIFDWSIILKPLKKSSNEMWFWHILQDTSLQDKQVDLFASACITRRC